jgi:hypothetical protein
MKNIGLIVLALIMLSGWTFGGDSPQDLLVSNI